MTKPLWSDERIWNEMLQLTIEEHPYEAALDILTDMRDEYEDELDKLREEMARRERGDDD